jgi:polysaccharide export outer membrane protein
MQYSYVTVLWLKILFANTFKRVNNIMSKSVLLPIASIAGFILFMFLALPLISSAEQIEDISETEQQVRVSNEGTPNNSETQSPPSVAQPSGLAVPTVENSAPATTPEQLIKSSVINQEPVVSPEKIAEEKPAPVTVKRDGAVTPDLPVTAQKATDVPTPSTWNSFLAAVGLHDDRHSIPPKEVKSSALQLGQDYIIGPGDLLSISVWRDDSLSRSVVVLPDGKIQFPLIGEIVAGGKSVAQLKQEFVGKLSSFVIDADISVEVKQSNSLFIYIIGRVNGPGRQMLVADTTVLQGLAMAGGLNPFAEKDDIKIFRQEKDRTLVYSFRYSQVVTGNYLDDNLLLKRGDVIVVP